MRPGSKRGWTDLSYRDPLNTSNQPQQFVLSNGLKVYTLVHRPIKTLTLHCWIFAGSIYENQQNNGISHFLEHMLFRGNQKLGSSVEMSLGFERLGGQLNAATSFDGTEYWLECHKDYFESAVSQFADFLRYPSFEQIETERAIILEEIKSDYNDQDQLIDLDQLASQAIWPAQPMGLSISGTAETVGKITKDQLVQWYQTYYHPKNMMFGISGDFDPEQLRQLLEASLGDLPEGKRWSYTPPVANLASTAQIEWVLEPDNQVQFAWTFVVDQLTPVKRLIIQLIARMLDDGSSSRLQRWVREEHGLVYDIAASPSFFDSGATLMISVTVGKERLTQLIDVLVKLIDQAVQEGFGPEELHLAKLRLQSELDCFTDTAEGRLHEAVAPQLAPCYLGLEQLGRLIEECTLEQINQQTTEILGSKSACFTFVGPTTDKEKPEIQKMLSPWLA